MIGEKLKELLHKHKITQAELSRKLNISPGSMSCYINNRQSPDFELLAAIAAFFAVSIDYFIPIPLTSGSGKSLMLSELTYNNLIQLKNGTWIKVDTKTFEPVFTLNSLIYVEDNCDLSARDLILYFSVDNISIYRFHKRSGNILLTPLRKDEPPLNIKGTLKGAFKILYTAYKP
jgi:transcriptional regulator with XRE-family HTH domain